MKRIICGLFFLFILGSLYAETFEKMSNGRDQTITCREANNMRCAFDLKNYSSRTGKRWSILFEKQDASFSYVNVYIAYSDQFSYPSYKLIGNISLDADFSSVSALIIDSDYIAITSEFDSFFKWLYEVWAFTQRKMN